MKKKRKSKYTMDLRIPDTPENVMKAILSTPPRKLGENGNRKSKKK